MKIYQVFSFHLLFLFHIYIYINIWIHVYILGTYVYVCVWIQKEIHTILEGDGERKSWIKEKTWLQ